MVKINNPILKGSYPDPSICRAGDDFYLICSSFSYYPGLPIFHSKDLSNWEQIGYVLNRFEQLHVTYEYQNLGIFAPSIRYHNGTFYVICTNMTTHENFIVTATDPAGPWSDLIQIPQATGIDPSLFFDDDGKVYFTGTCGFNTGKYGKQAIICAEIDVKTGLFIGDEWPIGFGAAINSANPEAPHLYKKDGWYYLMIAEGGTQQFHCETISRTRDLHEPFEQYQANPIITHRHLGWEYPISNVGHFDLIDTPDGDWYAVGLGSRIVNGYHKPCGRETFICPVEWQYGWPCFAPGVGHLETSYTDCKLSEYKFSDAKNGRRPNGNLIMNAPVQKSIFETGALGMEWAYLGTPYENYTSFENEALAIKMLPKTTIPEEFEGTKFDFWKMLENKTTLKENVAFVARRILDFDFEIEALLKVSFEKKEAAGIALMQNNAVQLIFELSAGDNKNSVIADVIKVEYILDQDQVINYKKTTLGHCQLAISDQYQLFINSNQNYYTLSIKTPVEEHVVAEKVSGNYLGMESTDSFLGIYAGMYATSNGAISENKAYFSYFNYKSL